MQRHHFGPYGCRIIILLLFAALKIHSVGGQVTVDATVSGSSTSTGELVDITISALENSDLYYAELEVLYDYLVLEFVSVANGSLTGDGIHIAGELGPGRTGVSVSRTAPLEEAASGAIMVITFRVKEFASAGNTEIGFSSLHIVDSEGESILSEDPGPVVLNVETLISGLWLLIPAENSIEVGELFNIDASVYAAGVSDEGRVVCQVGVSSLDTGPESWPGEMWTDLVFSGTDETGNLVFSGEIASGRPAGEWFVAVRASLDADDFVFGGPGGMLDGSGSGVALLNIVPPPPYIYSLASWAFDDESLLPSAAVYDNRNAAVEISGATNEGFITGYGGLAVNSKNWSVSGSPGYWWVEISTKGFASLEISSRQYGSGTGPRDFRLEYSIDGFQWNPVDGGDIVVASNWTEGRLDRVPLPGVVEDKDRVLIRWINSSDISINGAITGSSGTNRIDDIIITGVNPDPQSAVVFPGDANNDGVVNADDVLPLGLYWLSRGPSSPWEGFEFSGRNIEQWIPPGATYADTNGDGIVDHRDLLAVGMHFGKTASPATKDSTEPLATLVVDPLEGGRIRKIMVESADATSLRGIAVSLRISGIPSGMWDIKTIAPVFAGNAPEEEMISFSRNVDDLYEAAFVLKGGGDDLTATSMVGFELVIDEEWDDEFTVYLNRISVSTGSSPGKGMREGKLVLAEYLTPVPDAGYAGGKGFGLQVNPNPFQETAGIFFNLASPSFVKLDIICMRGRIMATPYNGFLEQGSHRIVFDGTSLAPGFYLCRIASREGQSQIIKMIRVP